jgi:tetratricopeptide (TPR) repeat protein
MMKKMFIAAAILLFSQNIYGQDAAQWQSDLRWLQQTVHARYNNLFYNISAADWDNAVDSFNNKIPILNNTQRLAGFIKLVALFHVGHTQLSTFALHGGHDNPLALHRYPYQLYWFSDGLYITRADTRYANAVGGKVTRLGNMNAADALQAVRPLVSYENEQGFKSNSVAYLTIPEFLFSEGISSSADEIQISYMKNGKEVSTVFKSGSNDNIFSSTSLVVPAGWVDAKQSTTTPLWQKEPSSLRYMEYLPATKTLYVRHSATVDDGDKKLAAFFNDMAEYIDKNDVQKLVLDIRLNGGGNNYLNKPIITNIIASKKINQKGKFFCIIGRRTFSAAQNLVNELEKYTEVIFIGEPTGENVNFYGDTKTETLPATKLPVNLSWLWWQNLDPRDKRKTTSPQLAADMSFADYYNNLDPAMDAILNYDKMKAFVPTLRELVNAGKTKEALQFAIDYRKDPINRYYISRLEADVNQEGYNVMDNNPALANAFFEINIQLFPESANAYDSYAESFMRMGKKDEAIKYYEMAIAKDKEGQTAENAKKMIEKIKSGR